MLNFPWRHALALALTFATLACDDGGSGDPTPITDDAGASADGAASGDDAATDPDAAPDPDDGVDPDGTTPDAAPPEPDAAPRPPAYDCSADWLALTEGVTRIDLGGALPDLLVVYGERACPIVLDPAHKGYVASAHVGGGRVFHAAHEALIQAAPDRPDDTHRLLTNALWWLNGSDDPFVIAAEAGLAGALRTVLQDLPVQIVDLDLAALADVDVVALTTYAELDPVALGQLHTFIEAGGGLLSGGHAWWWASQTGRNAPTEFAGNRILATAGIVLAGTGEIDTTPTDLPDAPPGPECQASNALDLMLDFLDGAALPFDRQVVAANTASVAIRVLPLSFDAYFDRARGFLDASEPVIPTKAVPVVPAEQPIQQLVVVLENKFAKESPPDEVVAVAAAADFPGAVPADAERVTRTVSVDGDYAGRSGKYAFSNAGARLRRPTGLYAPPGEVLTVVVPEPARGRIDVLIGAHSDRLWNRDRWERFPDVVRAWPLESARNRVASGFGGPITIRVPPGSALGTFEVTIEGAVEMPRYVRGETTVEDWATARQHPGPWAELATEGIILTVPSSAVRDLDAGPVMAFWQEVMDAANTLAGIDDRVRPERFVLDRQISAGWMHSGYPLMAHLESTRDFVDVDFLRAEGSWGPFHEIGHNYQWRDWVLPGTIETSCNLWSVYIYETVVGRESTNTHEAIGAEQRAARRAAYLDGGANFADWSVWVALDTYLQLQEAFGWALLTDLMVEYRALANADQPADDPDRIDQWVVRSAHAAGVNLGPFYLAWGFPVSPAALDAIADLPPWDGDPMAGLD